LQIENKTRFYSFNHLIVLCV